VACPDILSVCLYLDSVESVEQTKGAGLVPKRAMDVMSCEVNRLVLLTQQSVIAVPYIVPRKVRNFIHKPVMV